MNQDYNDVMRKQDIDCAKREALLSSIRCDGINYATPKMLQDIYMHNKDDSMFAGEILSKLEAAGDSDVRGRYSKVVARHNPKMLQAISAADLDKMVLPELKWFVQDILPSGVAMLAAPSKSYKSFLALDLCVQICTGGMFLGRQCDRSGCLYLDLESSERRPQQRLNMLVGEENPKPDNLYIITASQEVNKLGKGFEDQITHQIQMHPDIKFVVVDVYQKIRPDEVKSVSGYNKDYNDFAALKKLSNQLDIGILLIHHTRKMRDTNDAFNKLNGSAGIMASLDCIWLLDKDNRSDKSVTLKVIGRDLKEDDLAIELNQNTLKWEYLGSQEEVESFKNMNKIQLQSV